ncbi:MAG: VOC family protein [Chromatiales bacterium]|nr:VOC family protein [Chromatiales bacterium]
MDARFGPVSRSSLLAVVGGAVLSVLGLAAGATVVPPISDPPTGEYRHGKFVWIDLVTADLPAAEKFYGAMFGWTFARLGPDPGRYSVAYLGGFPVAGLAARPPAAGAKNGTAGRSWWIAFMSVSDVDRAAADVVAKGGKVLIPARNLDDRGRMAVLADPDGAPFGLIRSSSGDPPDFRAEPGEWIWAVYQSTDAGSAAAFYQDLGNYEVVPGDQVGTAETFSLQAEGYARASLVEIPAGRTELRPEWLYFVRVRDVAVSLARVVELGGRVIAPPRPDLLDGRLAVITDPGGALLGLMAWDPGDGGDN